MLRWVDNAIPVGFYHGLYALGVGGAPSGTIVTLFQQGTATDTTAFPKYVTMKCTLIVVHKKTCYRCSTNLVIGCLRSSGLVPQTTNANTNDELNNNIFKCASGKENKLRVALGSSYVGVGG